MTVLATGLNQTNTPNFAVAGGRTYHFNDFDPPQVWNGQWATTLDMGIAAYATAPTVANSGVAGAITAGLHQVRFRYKDSSSEYVSDPTPATVITAPGSFKIDVTVVASADAKVDTIVVEMTPVNSADFYVLGEASNANATIAYSVSDATLVVQQSVGATYGDFGHEQPPLTAGGVMHRGRMFLFGTHRYSTSLSFASTPSTAAVLSLPVPDDAVFNYDGRTIRVEGTSYDEVFSIASTGGPYDIAVSPAYAGTAAISLTGTIYRKTPNRIWWSKELYPEGFSVLEDFRDMLQGRPDRVVGAVSYGGDLIVFGRFSAERLVYESDPGIIGGQTIPLAGNRGIHNQRCMMEIDGNLFCWDRQGVWLVQSDGSKHISLPIDDYLTGNADYSQSDDFFLAYDPSMRILYAFFTATGDTAPKWAACLEIDSNNWYLASFLQAIKSATVVPTTAGVVKLMLGDENGKLWFAGTAGSFDGREGDDTNVLSYLSGTSTITFSPAITTDPSGRMLYRASTGQALPVAIWSSSTSVGLSAPFASPAMVVGEQLYLAPIIMTWQTKWWTGDGLADKKKPLYLFIESVPLSTEVDIEVTIYTDFSTTAETWTAGSLDTFPDGVTVTSGSSTINATLGMDGFIAIPLGSDWKRSYQARIQQKKPVGEIEITGIYFGTTRNTSSTDARGE